MYPDATELETLAELADTGDVYAIVERAQQKIANSGDEVIFWTHLDELAQSFQISPIKAFIEQGLSG